MSSFMRGAAGFNAQVLRANFNFNGPATAGWWGVDTTDPWDDGVLWTQTGMLGAANPMLLESTRWAPPPRKYGGQQMKKFVGITRDSAGAVLGTAVVQGFRTAPDEFVRETVSDAGGYFELCSQYVGQNHYLVAYKAGSPDVAGTTLNTLQPS